MDPMTLVMLALVAVLIFFMFRNSKKRQAQMAEMQNNTRPGAEVMLQSGIYGTIESIDEEENRVTVRSGTSTFVVHRNAIGQVLTPAASTNEEGEAATLAPDDDPAFGERVNAADASDVESAAPEATSNDSATDADSTDQKPSDKE